MYTPTYRPQVDSIIFDLDGTLWDATAAVAEGWQKMAQDQKLNVQVSAASIARVAGLPFLACVESIFGPKLAQNRSFTQDLEIAEKWQVSKSGGSFYPGVRETIPRLAQKYKLYVVSNCQQWYLDNFLEKSGLGIFFQAAYCHGQKGLSKTENIKKLVKNFNLKRPLYLGDTIWDQQAAFYADCKFVFAAYGFGAVNLHRTPAFQSFNQFSEWMLMASTQLPEVSYRRLTADEFSEAEKFYSSVDYSISLAPSSDYYGAFLDQELIGLVRIASENGSLVLRGMQVRADFQFFGIGTRLLKLLELDLQNRECYCLPHAWLEKFYGQIGFKVMDDLMYAPEFLAKRFEAYLQKYPELIIMRKSL